MSVSERCPKDHVHVHARGSVRLPDGKWAKRALLSAVYPPHLCIKWGRAVARACLRLAEGTAPKWAQRELGNKGTGAVTVSAGEPASLRALTDVVVLFPGIEYQGANAAGETVSLFAEEQRRQSGAPFGDRLAAVASATPSGKRRCSSAQPKAQPKVRLPKAKEQKPAAAAEVPEKDLQQWTGTGVTGPRSPAGPSSAAASASSTQIPQDPDLGAGPSGPDLPGGDSFQAEPEQPGRADAAAAAALGKGTWTQGNKILPLTKGQQRWMDRLKAKDLTGIEVSVEQFIDLAGETVIQNPRGTQEYKDKCLEEVGLGKVVDKERYGHILNTSTSKPDIELLRFVVRRGSHCMWVPDSPRTCVRGFLHRLITKGPPVRAGLQSAESCGHGVVRTGHQGGCSPGTAQERAVALGLPGLPHEGKCTAQGRAAEAPDGSGLQGAEPSDGPQGLPDSEQ
jgi:hypothetical protein